MATVQLMPLNLFDYDSGSTVGMTGATQDTDFPITNIHSRSKSRVWKGTTDGVPNNVLFNVSNADFNAAAFQCDTLVIPAGHNLNGLNIQIVTDPAGSPVTQYGPQAVTEENDEDIVISWATPAYHSAWRIYVTPVSTAWVMIVPELHLSFAEEMTRSPSRPSGAIDDDFNVRNEVSSGGYDWFIQYGERKRRRSYSFENVSSAQRVQIEAANAMWAGKRPFWIRDHEGTYLFVKLAKKLNLRETGAVRFSCDMELLEVIS